MRNLKSLVLERCGFISRRSNASIARRSGRTVWLVAGRGRRRMSRLLWLIAVTAGSEATARSRASAFARSEGASLSRVDAVFAMAEEARLDSESDFVLLRRRAESEGVAAIEITGARAGKGR